MYYACYYPEGEEFRKDVASIVNYFRNNGYNVKMDVMDSGDISSQGPSRWAESQIRKAKKVLVFLTPALVNLSRVDEWADSLQSQVTICFKLFFLMSLFPLKGLRKWNLMCSHNGPRFFADFQPNRRICMGASEDKLPNTYF